MHELTGLGAAELARRIRTGDASPLEVVDAHLKWIAEVEPRINALVTAAFYVARRMARRQTDTGVPPDSAAASRCPGHGQRRDRRSGAAVHRGLAFSV